MTDYYKILGVSRTASQEEIKRKYREMAKKYHPDANGNSQESEERFKLISEAYSVLSSASARNKYDSGFYNDDVFYNSESQRWSSSEETDSRMKDNYEPFYTFYYTYSGNRKRHKKTSKHPFLSILKGAVQCFFGGLLIISFIGFFPVLGFYITYLGVENVRRGLSSLY